MSKDPQLRELESIRILMFAIVVALFAIGIWLAVIADILKGMG
ncbi:TPA_asm: hypothetical protein vir521_00023 [Caudoviricetes sp. vir521]|nr:TPA_asm: hypothetical protein vir521_00023 [Caudoviricetes sp. vir521]